MLKTIHDQGAHPRPGQPRERVLPIDPAPFRAAIDFYRLDAERRKPAPRAASNQTARQPSCDKTCP
ncbi:hypothetical protein HUX88_24690 [Duganella sp. BJB1802]|uniref:hypothetical protein n=1 Tax=Duganella sp. BJB1802 TaxID=2744575 RepID=UPI0015932124|nr:hypothetical protein [Duganella sp. BJB1802]NVD73711.1 hypothetical protein [Duganella sp. BJB1802]